MWRIKDARLFKVAHVPSVDAGRLCIQGHENEYLSSTPNLLHTINHTIIAAPDEQSSSVRLSDMYASSARAHTRASTSQIYDTAVYATTQSAPAQLTACVSDKEVRLYRVTCNT
jgi:hypothetical protein